MDNEKIKAAPSARRLAKEYDIDLSLVSASNGVRITVGDVIAYFDEQARNEAKARLEQKAEIAKKAEQEALKKAEQEALLKAEQEALKKAEQEALLKAEQEASKKAEQEALLKAEQEALKKAEQEALKKAEQEALLKAEQEASKKAEQEALLKAEQEALKQTQANSVSESLRAQAEPLNTKATQAESAEKAAADSNVPSETAVSPNAFTEDLINKVTPSKEDTVSLNADDRKDISHKEVEYLHSAKPINTEEITLNDFLVNEAIEKEEDQLYEAALSAIVKTDEEQAELAGNAIEQAAEQAFSFLPDNDKVQPIYFDTIPQNDAKEAEEENNLSFSADTLEPSEVKPADDKPQTQPSDSFIRLEEYEEEPLTLQSSTDGQPFTFVSGEADDLSYEQTKTIEDEQFEKIAYEEAESTENIENEESVEQALSQPEALNIIDNQIEYSEEPNTVNEQIFEQAQQPEEETISLAYNDLDYTMELDPGIDHAVNSGNSIDYTDVEQVTLESVLGEDTAPGNDDAELDELFTGFIYDEHGEAEHEFTTVIKDEPKEEFFDENVTDEDISYILSPAKDSDEDMIRVENIIEDTMDSVDEIPDYEDDKLNENDYESFGELSKPEVIRVTPKLDNRERIEGFFNTVSEEESAGSTQKQQQEDNKQNYTHGTKAPSEPLEPIQMSFSVNEEYIKKVLLGVSIPLNRGVLDIVVKAAAKALVAAQLSLYENKLNVVRITESGDVIKQLVIKPQNSPISEIAYFENINSEECPFVIWDMTDLGIDNARVANKGVMNLFIMKNENSIKVNMVCDEHLLDITECAVFMNKFNKFVSNPMYMLL